MRVGFLALRGRACTALGRGGPPGASPPQRAEKGRSRPQSALLLRAVPAGTCTDLDKVRGRPTRELHNTTRFVEWCCHRLKARGKKALLLIWDNASWHKSPEVRNWIAAHNRQVKASGHGVRIVGCLLPTKSPWLNAIEPKWIHGKRKVLQSPRDCLALMSSPTQSAGSSIVRTTSIYPFHRRSPDCALTASCPARCSASGLPDSSACWHPP
jgi:transposase